MKLTKAVYRSTKALAVILAWTTAVAQADEIQPAKAGPTNQVDLEYGRHVYDVEDPPSHELVKRFTQELGSQNTTAAFKDTFGPASAFAWNRRINREGYGVWGDVNSMGYKLVGEIFTDSMRESAEAHFPLDYWEWKGQNMLAGAGSFFVRLFTGTFGNVNEEHANPIGTGFSEREDLWLGTADNRYSVGWRFWSTYVYYRKPFGTYNGKPIVVIETRGYYNPLSPHVTVQAVVPLVNRIRLVAGGRFDPLDFGKGENFYSASVRIEKVEHDSAYGVVCVKSDHAINIYGQYRISF
jgi:hypothetical protein